jgi:hypothetical protein
VSKTHTGVRSASSRVEGGNKEQDLFASFPNSGDQTIHLPRVRPGVTSFHQNLVEVTRFLRYLSK